MIKIGSIVLNVGDVPAAARFWADALGYEIRHESLTTDWGQIVPRNGGPNVSFDLRDQTHLDLYTADAADQQAEIERLIGLGAREVDNWPYPPDADFTVLADPSGNLFCVVRGGA